MTTRCDGAVAHEAGERARAALQQALHDWGTTLAGELDAVVIEAAPTRRGRA